MHSIVLPLVFLCLAAMAFAGREFIAPDPYQLTPGTTGTSSSPIKAFYPQSSFHTLSRGGGRKSATPEPTGFTDFHPSIVSAEDFMRRYHVNSAGEFMAQWTHTSPAMRDRMVLFKGFRDTARHFLPRIAKNRREALYRTEAADIQKRLEKTQKTYDLRQQNAKKMLQGFLKAQREGRVQRQVEGVKAMEVDKSL